MRRARLRYGSGVLIIVLFCSIPAVALHAEIPGWFLSGSTPEDYRVAQESGIAYNGSHSASLSSLADAVTSEFGTLMQQVDARQFAGMRIRFSAYVRTQDVNGGAALWMRVDGNGTTLSFDNMSHRGWIRGDSPWTFYSIVLDVPAQTELISFGLMLTGNGKVWVDDAALDPVALHVPTTGMPIPVWNYPARLNDLPPAPRNMDFEAGSDYAAATP